MRLVLGVGGRPDAQAPGLATLVDEVLDRAGCPPHDIAVVATLDRRARHDAVRELAARLDAQVAGFSAQVLAGHQVPHPSEVVRRHTGAGAVAEAAVLACGGRLVVTKRRGTGWTAALGVIESSQEAG